MNLVTMKDYIYATPQKVLDNVENAEALTQVMVDLYTKREYTQITFVASGSSYTAIQCVRGFLCEILHTDIKIINPYTFSEYDYRYIKNNNFVVVVSQSGASTNCIEALKKL
jgi:glucoselysine-6-phosphate deglycase